MSRTILISLLASVAGCASKAGPAAPEGSRPNILVIVADDLGWNDVSFHGSEIRTPRLDALARESVRLHQFYGYPTCSPTRAMLLTGRNASRFGIRGPLGLNPKDALPIQTVSLADLLSQAGYETALSGKWHLGPTFEGGPRRQGFQEARGYLHGQIDQYTHKYKDLSASWFRDEQFVDEPGHATDLIAQGAIDFIRRPRAKPFFLYVAFSVPHYPLQVDPAWEKPYEQSIPHKDRRRNAAMVTHMDDAVGRILAALDQAGTRGNTFVLFTSDNGGQQDWKSTDYGGLHGPYERLGDNRPLRGWKGNVYEGGIRLVALANWRGRLAPRELPEVTSAMDLFPTAAALAGVPVGPELKVEGSNIFPLLAGTGERESPTIYWNTASQNGLRVGDWKIVETRQGSKVELFNMASDPQETRDLAADEPERARSMREQLVRMKAGDPKP